MPVTEPSPVNDLMIDLIRSDEVDDRFSSPIEARKKAMDYLARREHSQLELCRKMEKFGFGRDVSLDAIEQLQKDGLQSDRRFVEAFLQSRISQGKGPARIRADLSQRGIRDAMIQAVLAEAGEDWFALARETRLKKFGAEVPSDFKEKARQMRFLQYRGFEPNQIQAAVSAYDE
jgi:regulatory protein